MRDSFPETMWTRRSRSRTATVFLLVVVIGTAQTFPLNGSFITNDEEFIPNHEWQPIKEGQAIPPGLHVRLNLQTGEREAKLLDDPRANPKPNPVALIANSTSVKKHEKGLIADLLDRLKASRTADEQISILKDLEDLLHQYDHAIRFTDLNGLEVLQNLLNRTDINEQMRQLILLTFGAAFQGNVQVQQRAYQLGLVEDFLELLRSEVNPTTESRAIFALSTLLRHFPDAQTKFLDQEGLNLFRKLFHRSELQKKILGLITDLLQDSNRTRLSSGSFQPWCSDIFNHLFSISLDDFDQIEITLQALIRLTDVCRMDLLDLLARLDQLNDVYRKDRTFPSSLRTKMEEFRANLHHQLLLLSSSDL